MRMRWTAYAGVSTTLAAGVILKALAQRPNFYSAAVYLAQSSANVMILTNLVFMLACGTLLLLQKTLYGPLRPIEVEQLYEKAWFAVTETCLAMTIFRGEIGATFLIMFFALLAGKVWGWIGEGRVEILEQQPPANPRLFHTRLMASLLLSVMFDVTMLEYIIKEVVGMARPDMMVMFGFEFGVLTILSSSTLVRYVINIVDIWIVRKQKMKRIEEIRKERKDAQEAHARAQAEQAALPVTDETGTLTTETAVPSPAGLTSTTVLPAPLGPGPEDPVEDVEVEVEGWEEKGRYVFYLDLMTDFLKLVVYLSFFFILLVFYGLPIHIMRDVFLTCRSFFKRIADFIRYRTATRDMNERYPDATPEEIGSEDVCIICREEMRPMPPVILAPGAAPPPLNPVAERMRPKKLPCGHILHFSCLRSWLERQQICPTCRRPVVPGQGQPGQAGAANAANPAGGPVVPGQNAAPGQPVQPNEQGVDGQNRARVFQLGPLRIGVGAGRGMFEDLVQQIHNGDAPPAQEGARNGPQQYGFGFGIGRGNRRPREHSHIQAHIDRAERHIQREINSLRLATNELQVVRGLQAELERLRGLRNAGTAETADPNLGSGHQHATTTHAPRQVSAFVANAQRNPLPAGSSELPEGLALPEGWTMLPLARLAPPQLLANQPHPTAHASPGNGPLFTFPPNGNQTVPPLGPGWTAHVNGQQIPVQSMFTGQPLGWAPHQAGQTGPQPAANPITIPEQPLETLASEHAALNLNPTTAMDGSTMAREDPSPTSQSVLNSHQATSPPVQQRHAVPAAPPNEEEFLGLLGAPQNQRPPTPTQGDANRAPAAAEERIPRDGANGRRVPSTNSGLPAWGNQAPLFPTFPDDELNGAPDSNAAATHGIAEQNGSSNAAAAATNGDANLTVDTTASVADMEGVLQSQSITKPKPASVEDSIEDPD